MLKLCLKSYAKSAILSLLSLFILQDCLAQTPALFQSDEVLELTLSCDMKAVQNDRGQESQYHEAKVIYKEGGQSIDIPVRIKTRGGFRKIRSNCKYPPLWLNFAKATTPKTSIFRGQDKTKMVTPCSGDEYVINEYLAYKLYNLVTPKSLKARLVKVVFHDAVKDKSSDANFAMILEEEKQMAKRNGAVTLDTKMLDPRSTEKEDFLKMAVFQYLIANTDWSVQYKQNIKLIAKDTTKKASTVAYDFDHAGIVRAPYAKPAAELRMSSTLQRRYRGYCIKDMSELASTFDFFNSLKDDIYAVYTENPLLKEQYVKRTIKFLDDFFEIINDQRKARLAFTYPCDPSGTGNIVIKGLKEN
jgi:hypothetical protein